jgi:hypothetical protein
MSNFCAHLGFRDVLGLSVNVVFTHVATLLKIHLLK